MCKYYEEAKEFGKTYLLPYTNDVDLKGRFPSEAYEALKEHKYFSLVIPKEYGGQGLGIVEHAKVCIALAENDASAALCYMMSNVGTTTISMYASEELKQDVLVKVSKEKATIGLAYSETGTGTHFYIPEVTAEQKDGYAILNGKKSFVTSARHADYYLTSSKNINTNETILWVIPADSKGLTFDSKASWDGVGLRGNESIPMILDNVKIDNHYKIDGNGDGDRLIFVVGLSSVCAGVNMKMAEVASEYAKSRRYSMGQTLADLETVEVHLGDIYANAYASREAIISAARSVASNHPDSFKHVIAARIISTQNGILSGTIGMRVVGGKGYVRGTTPMERLLRDSLGGQVMAPGIDVLRIWLGRLLADLPYMDIFKK